MNNIGDLNAHLFAQLERLSDPELSNSDISTEHTRTRALMAVSEMILESGKLILQAEKVNNDKYDADKPPNQFFDIVSNQSVIEE